MYVSEGPFGKTERFYAVVDGAVDDLVTMRDTATQALLDAGFKLLTKDAEPPIEAEGHVQGKYHGQRAGDRAVRRQVAAPVHGLLT